jgi:hypothetical protein
MRYLVYIRYLCHILDTKLSDEGPSLETSHFSFYFLDSCILCESFHWLTDAHRLTNEKTLINLDQSQTEFKYCIHQSEAGCSCDQSLLVVSFLSQEALAPRVTLAQTVQY